jgi:hypothetical protein
MFPVFDPAPPFEVALLIVIGAYAVMSAVAFVVDRYVRREGRK